MIVGMGHKQEVGESLVPQYEAQDLADHRKRGRPYNIIQDEVVGRHMVASRVIKAGETIMEDLPLTHGPHCSSDLTPVCLGCYRPVSGDCLCQTCGWPVCGEACAQMPHHRDAECSFFADRGIRVDAASFTSDSENTATAYSCISPLRALLLKTSDPDRWNRVWGLMSHNTLRRKEEYWRDRHQPIVTYITDTLGISDFTAEEIDTVLGIFLVNDFEISGKVDEDEWSSSGKSTVRGLYQIASIPNHDCVANTIHQFSPLAEGFRMVVKAVRDIKKGEDITHSYVDPQESVLARQELLTMGKFFHCLCSRCSDPTELGTYCSALKCPSCKQPVISTNPGDLKADWACTKCKRKFQHLKVSNVTAAIKEKAEKLEQNKETPELCDIPAHEAFIKKFSNILHSKHILLITAKYTLSKMYGRMSGYEADKLSDQQLARKQALAEEVLEVLDLIMPGCSRMRGVMLYELHLPLVMLANRKLQKGPGSGVDPKQIKTGLRRGLECMEEGLDILRRQPEGSFEFKIAEGSQQSRKELKDWVKKIETLM